MKYYLVAVFDKDSNLFIERIQKNICKKFKLHNITSTLYINLETLINPDMQKLYSIISDILKPYKYFKVMINKDLEFDPNNKEMNLKVENKGYIARLSRKIDSELILNGFKKEKSTTDLNIHLGNTRNNFNKNQILNYDITHFIEESNDPYITAKITQLELWKIPNNKKRIIVKNFPLNEY